MLVLNFGMLKFPVSLCVFECVSLRLCVSVPACECCMILFTYNLYQYVDVSFFTYCLQVYLCVCDNSGMFNVCVCIFCVYVTFQTNTPAAGRHEREPGRRIHHGGSQPQRRPLMVPSIGQYGQLAREMEREYLLLC